MPRMPRVKKEEAIYHVMVRGNNKEPVFFSDDDRYRYYETLKRYKEKYRINIYTYCLMDNHIHLIIDSNGQDISKIMQGISLSYTQYINRRYNRCGHLFQDRFKSYIVDKERYMTTVVSYIHQNPVKAGIVKAATDYKWSSIHIYAGKRDIHGIIDEEYVLGLFSSDKRRARELFLEHSKVEIKDYKPEIEDNKYENRDKKVKAKGENIKEVLKKVTTIYGICEEDITNKYSRIKIQEKKIAQYLIYLKSKMSYREIGQRFGVCGSAVGQNIRKAVEIIKENIEKRRYFELILQS